LVDLIIRIDIICVPLMAPVDMGEASLGDAAEIWGWIPEAMNVI
jgi:hypothetical protein